MGRGYQPRENETLGRPYGSTIQDQERNRKAFEEVVAIIQQVLDRAVVLASRREFFRSRRPTRNGTTSRRSPISRWTRSSGGWRTSSRIGAPDMYSAGNPVQATTTTLKELQVFPQPVQKPHPQIWEPLTSARSIKWAAEHGINGVIIVEPNDRLKKNIDIYYEAAEKAGWPDMLNRGRFKYRLGRAEAPRHHDQPLHPHHHARQGEAGAGPRRARDGTAVRLLRAVRLRRRRGAAGRADVRPQQEGDGGDAARARDRHPGIEAVRHRQDHEDEATRSATTISASSAGSSSAASRAARSRTRCSFSPRRSCR